MESKGHNLLNFINDKIYRWLRNYSHFGYRGGYFGKWAQHINAIKRMADSTLEMFEFAYLDAGCLMVAICCLLPSHIAILVVAALYVLVLLTVAKQVLTDEYNICTKVHSKIDGEHGREEFIQLYRQYKRVYTANIVISTLTLMVSGILTTCVSFIIQRIISESLLPAADVISSALDTAATLLCSAAASFFIGIIIFSVLGFISNICMRKLLNRVIQRANRLLEQTVQVDGRITVKDDILTQTFDNCRAVTVEDGKFIFYTREWIECRYGRGKQCWDWVKLGEVDLKLHPEIYLADKGVTTKILDSENYKQYF